MLDSHAETVPTVTEIEQLPCSVGLPAAWENDFELQGLAPRFQAASGAFRGFAAAQNSIIALEQKQTFPSLPRSREWYAVYITDIAGRHRAAPRRGSVSQRTFPYRAPRRKPEAH